MRIIEVPNQTRGRQGMTEVEATEYAENLAACEKGQGVVVDNSNSDDYEKAYSRGERVRNALDKFSLRPKDQTMVRAIQVDEEYIAVLLQK